MTDEYCMFEVGGSHAVADEPTVENKAFYGQHDAEEKAGKELKWRSFRKYGKEQYTESQGCLHGTGYNLVPAGGTAVGFVWNETCDEKEERESPANRYKPNKRTNQVLP